MLEGLRGEESIAELCRREQINQNLYYRWSKEFLEAGKKRLAGDTKREATSDEVQALRVRPVQLKELLAEVMLENRLLKKTCSAMARPVYEVHGVREAGDYSSGRTVSSRTNRLLQILGLVVKHRLELFSIYAGKPLEELLDHRDILEVFEERVYRDPSSAEHPRPQPQSRSRNPATTTGKACVPRLTIPANLAQPCFHLLFHRHSSYSRDVHESHT